MLSIGLPNDEDSQGEEAPCCRKCGHEMGQDWFEEWYCLGCEPKPEEVIKKEELIPLYIEWLMDLWSEPILASARQRAEAFLRTLGKWEEEG